MQQRARSDCSGQMANLERHTSVPALALCALLFIRPCCESGLPAGTAGGAAETGSVGRVSREEGLGLEVCSARGGSTEQIVNPRPKSTHQPSPITKPHPTLHLACYASHHPHPPPSPFLPARPPLQPPPRSTSPSRLRLHRRSRCSSPTSRSRPPPPRTPHSSTSTG